MLFLDLLLDRGEGREGRRGGREGGERERREGRERRDVRRGEEGCFGCVLGKWREEKQIVRRGVVLFVFVLFFEEREWKKGGEGRGFFVLWVLCCFGWSMFFMFSCVFVWFQVCVSGFPSFLICFFVLGFSLLPARPFRCSRKWRRCLVVPSAGHLVVEEGGGGGVKGEGGRAPNRAPELLKVWSVCWWVKRCRFACCCNLNLVTLN